MPIAFIPIPQPWPASLILHSQAITAHDGPATYNTNRGLGSGRLF
jgi:hypothetical protein